MKQLREKSILLNLHLAKVASKLKGQSPGELKHWYQVVGEKAITFGASIWAASQSEWLKEQLNAIQRPFLLKIAKAYSTAPTTALQVLTGIPPLHLTARMEAQKANILRGIQVPGAKPPSIILNGEIQRRVPLWETHPAERHIQIKINQNSAPRSVGFNIYTDGSKTEHGVGSAVVIYENGKRLGDWAAKLGNDCSVFQAELRAIDEALSEAVYLPSTVTILSDSL